MKTFTFRLKPGQDLKKSILDFAKEKEIEAGFIVTCVGGLKKATIRMAGATPDNQVIKTIEEKLEIVSLVGTLSEEDCHLHISVSNKNGEVIGGHLKNSSIIAFTAEVVIGVDTSAIYKRLPDAQTGFDELVVEKI